MKVRNVGDPAPHLLGPDDLAEHLPGQLVEFLEHALIGPFSLKNADNQRIDINVREFANFGFDFHHSFASLSRQASNLSLGLVIFRAALTPAPALLRGPGSPAAVQGLALS